MNQEREKSVHSQEVVTLTTKQADTWVVRIVYVQTRSKRSMGTNVLLDGRPLQLYLQTTSCLVTKAYIQYFINC